MSPRTPTHIFEGLIFQTEQNTVLGILRLNGEWTLGAGLSPCRPRAQRSGLVYAIAPPQLEPAPAVHPKQCDAVAILSPVSSPTSSTVQIVRFALPNGISSIWLKSQS